MEITVDAVPDNAVVLVVASCLAPTTFNGTAAGTAEVVLRLNAFGIGGDGDLASMVGLVPLLDTGLVPLRPAARGTREDSSVSGAVAFTRMLAAGVAGLAVLPPSAVP
jgi:hypothetical protein